MASLFQFGNQTHTQTKRKMFGGGNKCTKNAKKRKMVALEGAKADD